MIEVTFTCNVCRTEYVMQGLQKREPIGWGTVRPTLRVNSGPWSKNKKEQDEQLAFDSMARDLKKQLGTKEYHLCHKCLKTAQGTILQIEDAKKRG